jgi:hypothetical protein
MRTMTLLLLALVSVVSTRPLAAPGDAQAPQVAIPKPGVPQIMTLEGNFVRVAYNNEGYAILGYRIAQLSLGEEWMLIEFGTTLRDGVPRYKLTRDALSLELPDGKTIPMASVVDYRAANLAALQNRMKVQRDSINYFPPSAGQACRIGFYSELTNRAMAYEEVELSNQRACVGQLFFKVPGGIKYGQHWLNVKFQNSLIRVPFRILTKDEEQVLSKNYKDIRRQVEDTFKKK